MRWRGAPSRPRARRAIGHIVLEPRHGGCGGFEPRSGSAPWLRGRAGYIVRRSRSALKEWASSQRASSQGGAARGRLAGASPPLRLQLDFLPPSPPASPAPQWRPWRGWLPTSRRWREEAGVRLAHLPTSYLPTATSELCSLTRSSSSAARSQRNVPTYSTLKMYQQKEILQSL